LDVGEIEVVVGVGLLIVNVWAFEVPPPGVGLKTVMSKVPAVVRSEVKIAAVTRVELIKVVLLAEPANFTTESAIKFVR